MHRLERSAGAVCKSSSYKTSTSTAPPHAASAAAIPPRWASVRAGRVERFYHPLIPAVDGTLDAPRPVRGFSRAVPAGDRSLPVIVMAGAKPGPTLLILAGEHGDEYEGMATIHMLAKRLEVAELAGTVVAVVCCSVDAYLAEDRRSSTDGKNMARCYPGNAAGTLTERATATIQRDFIEGGGDRQPALVLSLHTTGPTCSEVTLVAYNMCAAETPEMTALQRRAALAMALPSMLVWGHAVDLQHFAATPIGEESSGRTPMYGAFLAGIPSLYMETTWTHGGEKEYTESVLRLLCHLGMRDEPLEPFKPRLFKETGIGSGHVQGGPYNSPVDGLYKPAVPLWTEVQPGDLIGTVFDLLGDVLYECRAVSEGTVIVQVHLRHVTAGYFLAVVI
eukprot:SAG31_NODE_398_length_16250_cov_8.737601_13_plen_392_part_00